MNHYIILTPSISNMGGSEMFTSNKTQYLQKLGWDVRVFFANSKGEIKIDLLRQFSSNCIPEIGFGFYYINKYRRSKIISRICKGIEKDDITIIESHLVGMTFWGEMIAQHCNGKNIVNPLEEKIKPLKIREASFFEFKLKRWEVLNASLKSLHRIFNERYKDEYTNYTHAFLEAYCSNVITEDDNSILLPTTDGKNIMSIGRLEKPYILPMFKEINKFVNQYSNKRFNILVIGGSTDGEVEKEINSLFKNSPNVSLYQYGYVYPIPRNIIMMADVSIASANSVLVTANHGIPTISIDIHDSLPIGIYGRTTKNIFLRDKEPIQQISNLLHDVLIAEKYSKIPSQSINDASEIERVFSKQISFLKLSTCDYSYYKVETIHNWAYSLYFQAKYLLIRLFGR